MNRMIEIYLSCYWCYRQNDWDELLPYAEFAYNSYVSEELGSSPFEIDLGWVPKSPLELISAKPSRVQGAEDFKTELQDALHDAQFSYKVARARQAAYSSMRYRAQQCAVGNKVWINKTVFSDSYSRAQSSDMLTAKRYGLFVIQDLVGKNAVRLELPDQLKIHPVVHVIHTTPYPSQTPDIAVPLPEKPAPVPAALGDERGVEAILAHRRRGRGYQFLTLLKGTGTHDAELQPIRDFIDPDGTMTQALRIYLDKNHVLLH
jgi:hypothetical protein